MLTERLLLKIKNDLNLSNRRTVKDIRIRTYVVIPENFFLIIFEKIGKEA